MNLLIISNKKCIERDSKDFSHYISRELSDSLAVTVVCAEDLLYQIHTNPDENRITIEDGNDITGFDTVFIKRADSTSVLAVTIVQYLKFNKVKFITSDLASDQNITNNKIVDHMFFSIHRLPIPKTFILTKHNVHQLESLATDTLNFPMVCKAAIASKGENNFLVNSFDEVVSVVVNSDSDFLLQEFIPNSYDYRVLVFGFKARLVIKRTRLDDSTHLNNTSRGAKAELVGLPAMNQSIIELSERSSKLLSREIAGVDIIEDEHTGRIVLLEINRPPEIETGSFVTEKCEALATYLIEG